ncbi:hypothetical protein [Prauserella muralis]|uniref:Uncharacterized protein n=1 Tax=Prauserella muralis TaxID=588067 RepID=A0A2V4AZX3_9PSEU|nr:hypothetical protein [Prauserella muralis]PXY27436.1 hypothetical protein BAY60_13455 [Prauserella muralis]TWE22864.1 hypothetical protein FHX69_4120 [Prauserella muralis]
MRPINRVDPKMPMQAMKTYSIIAPEETHWRQATCAEAGCGHHLRGWRTTVDERTDLGQFQADYIRKSSGRAFSEHRDDSGMTVFTFEPGQACFAAAQHRVRVDRQELFVVRGGDHRGSTGLIRQHTRPEDWVEDFAEHQTKLAEVINQG